MRPSSQVALSVPASLIRSPPVRVNYACLAQELIALSIASVMRCLHSHLSPRKITVRSDRKEIDGLNSSSKNPPEHLC
ncbi:hypothetical protein NDU88_003848 [Pleurodeles waltl]|uniref:Uncharacterized protein n=1 Tax=Pleurodeles waltl TaxID=8319 RepID=A0AAV7LJN0_PLEWA|nr:hypothetical protein NDU88_003848 [Pleurodeles waltl]